MESKIKAKYVVEWYNSIVFFKQTYIILGNPIVIIFWHSQYGTRPLKQNLFGWFIYTAFLTVNCWNNCTVRVVSAAPQTVHKLFVGGVHNGIGTLFHILVYHGPNTGEIVPKFALYIYIYIYIYIDHNICKRMAGARELSWLLPALLEPCKQTRWCQTFVFNRNT